jgi:calcineurin-like phosphoesterase family protein
MEELVMSREIWVISDTHFGHTNIIKYCNRPFESVRQMDDAMIQNWNSVVKPGDKVYHLGDVYMGDGEGMSKIFPKLNGRKRLILGNHDDLKRPMGSIKLGDVFEKIYLFRCFKELGLMLTHVPVHPESIIRAGEGAINVHGHIHDNPSPEGPYKCVCVEQINYTPINIEELRVN